jgi:hypothetical protein
MALPVSSCNTTRTVTLNKIRRCGNGSGSIPSTLEIPYALRRQGRIRGPPSLTYVWVPERFLQGSSTRSVIRSGNACSFTTTTPIRQQNWG